MKIFIKNRIPTLVALAILMISSGWASATDGRLPDCYIVSAGIDNYLNEGKLKGDVNDARNAVTAFAAQKGKMFQEVYARTLLDSQATHANIMKQMQDFSKRGKAGDFFVIFLSGHGGNYANNGGWYFCPYDENPNNNDNDLTSAKILNAADALMKQGKKVVVIIDACYSGRLGQAAQVHLNRYQNPNGGGLVLALSSSATQESQALGNYSAFAKAFVDGMAGAADANHDGRITLQELKAYSYNRTHQLLRQNNNQAKQDSTMLWSKSMSANSTLAAMQRQPGTASTAPVSIKPPAPIGVKALPAPAAVKLDGTWTGSETLANYGKLSFQFLPGGRLVMTDAKANSEGTWQQTGKQVTLRFYNDRVVYTGSLTGGILTGSARNGQTEWTFSVRKNLHGAE